MLMFPWCVWVSLFLQKHNFNMWNFKFDRPALLIADWTIGFSFILQNAQEKAYYLKCKDILDLTLITRASESNRHDLL